MTNQHQGNTALQWTNTFFRALYKYGIEHVVVSPGSRSTPLTLAVASNPHIQKHVILDERSAAFTALGIGKATNIPAVLVCTSGTALANYYPAVIEARQSGVPMVLATADRPPHLRATGANQAIDQLNMFGDYPVFFHEVGEPKPNKKDLKRLTILAQQSVSISREKRGPVHLNFPFRKPLEPTE
ncbi:MAG: 2-succinyl-5-enolpyruvyl-6-hydroxy-3-cyclohexene-1-carboxylic-acid synthase, partial [Aliifodinibius sp.]|nr:2-succinyl-5-enolpyruvyl-6-hydroxy-3-cyclohexene-1-carboxylic-acid synthase [Fodinibius sp.]